MCSFTDQPRTKGRVSRASQFEKGAGQDRRELTVFRFSGEGRMSQADPFHFHVAGRYPFLLHRDTVKSASTR